MKNIENFVLSIISEHESFKDVGDLKLQVYSADASKVVDRLQKWVDNSYFITWDEMTERIENEIKFLEGELEKPDQEIKTMIQHTCALRYLIFRKSFRPKTRPESHTSTSNNRSIEWIASFDISPKLSHK